VEQPASEPVSHARSQAFQPPPDGQIFSVDECGLGAGQESDCRGDFLDLTNPPDAGKLLHHLCVRTVLGADLSVDRSRLDAIDRLAC
jgi:hypothetical protein